MTSSGILRKVGPFWPGLGLLNAEVTDPGTLITVEKGDKLLNAPDLTFNGVVRKEWPVANGTFSLQTVFRYTDDCRT